MAVQSVVFFHCSFVFVYTGICGGSASGKTTVAKRIIEELDVQWVSLLSMDSFYKVGWNSWEKE